MMMHFKIPSFFILITLMKFVFPQNDFFHEELMLKPLPSGHVYAHFQFTTLWETTKDITTCKLQDISYQI